MERTYLSHVRLALVLLALSASLMFHSQLPRTGGRIPPQDRITDVAGIPLASLYVASALVTLAAGFAWYEHGAKGLKTRKAFIEGDLK